MAMCSLCGGNARTGHHPSCPSLVREPAPEAPRANPKYFGWLHREPGNGFRDTWVLTLKFDRTGTPIPEPYRVWNSHTPGNVIDAAEDFLDSRIVLHETLNSELGYRISL